MRIVVFGAAGNVGSRVVAEALEPVGVAGPARGYCPVFGG
jgi:uncharacterized protein YbjT (DUF2867 family)